MKRLSLLPLLLLALLIVPALVLARSAEPPALETLEPGGFQEISQDLDINVVFVGYEPGAGDRQLDESAFLDELPDTYRPVNRFPSFYKGNEFVGLTFNYDYNLIYADSDFEDEFFGYLSSIATPQPLTLYQELYNTQASRSLDVTENYWIDAPSVEQWLADHAGNMLGVDTTEYTIFYINWYDRADFKHHVYTKTDEPDPDTGFNFGEVLHSRKLIAWGGTTPDDEENGLGSLHRIWFYDLSAGPEAWTDNWDVDNPDLDGNGADEYRMPPVWEYGTPGPLPLGTLSGDLGKVTRYVALDLLFTTSPLYKVAISPPDLPGEVQVDINAFSYFDDVDVTALHDTDLIGTELGEVQPTVNYDVELQTHRLTRRLNEVANCFFIGAFAGGDSCYGQRLFNIAFGDLFLYFDDHLLQYIQGDGEYEVPVFAFYSSSDLNPGLLGFADDNWTDGTQSYVFSFDTPLLQSFGYGFSTTTIHEVGHHIGLSHPHDGYDYEADVDFGPSDEFYFAWSGDESNSMMSYIDLNWDFSQFDRDNMARFQTSAYLNQANVILADIYASPRAGQVADLLISADGHAAAALTEYQAMEYQSAAAHAQLAYGDVLAAAAQIRVPVEPQAWQADYKAKGASSMFVDEADYQRLKP